MPKLMNLGEITFKTNFVLGQLLPVFLSYLLIFLIFLSYLLKEKAVIFCVPTEQVTPRELLKHCITHIMCNACQCTLPYFTLTLKLVFSSCKKVSAVGLVPSITSFCKVNIAIKSVSIGIIFDIP